MKKLLSFLMMLVLVLSLTACNKDKESEKEEAKTEEVEESGEKTPENWVEPTDNTTFEKYLAEKVNSFNSKKLDELVGDVKLDTSVITDLTIPNLAVAFACTGDYLDSDMDGGKITVWQDGKEIYVYASQDGDYELGVIDLAQIEEMIPEVETVKPSEAINGLISTIFGSADVTLDTFLEKIEFSITDFNDKGNGNYELKHEALANLVEKISDGAVDAEEVLEGIEQSGVEITLLVNYSNGKVRSLAADILMEEDGYKQAQNVKLNFFYGPKGLKGLGTEVVADYVMPGMTMKMSAKEELTTDHMLTEVDLDMNMNGQVVQVESKLYADSKKVEGNLDAYVKANDALLEAEGTLAADSTKAKGSLKVNVTENGNTISLNATLDGNGTTNNIKAELKVSDNLIKLDATVSASEVKGTLEVSEKGKKIGTVTVDLKLAENWIKEGSVVVKDETGTFTINVTGGSSVKVPTVDKSEAEDLLEAMMGSNGSVEVKPNYTEEYYG